MRGIMNFAVTGGFFGEAEELEPGRIGSSVGGCGELIGEIEIPSSKGFFFLRLPGGKKAAQEFSATAHK